MYELHLFAGGGGGIYGGLLLGHRPIGAVEIEKYQQQVLLQRQKDGVFPKFPIWDDVRSFSKRNNGCRQFIKQLKRLSDNLIIAGGFPCQDISCAGKGAGLKGERSGLWAEYIRIIREIRPRYAFIENSPMLAIRGLDRVLCDLAKAGYNATWCVLGADDVGAPHRRKRMWILANSRDCKGRNYKSRGLRQFSYEEKTQEWTHPTNATSRPSPRLKAIPNSDNTGLGRREQLEESEQEARNPSDVLSDTLRERGTESQFQAREFQGARPQHRELDGANSLRYESWWATDPADSANATESELGRVAYGVANRGKRLETLGNGQVPAVAARAFKILKQNLERYNYE